jgi:hypothetical protein
VLPARALQESNAVALGHKEWKQLIAMVARRYRAILAVLADPAEAAARASADDARRAERKAAKCAAFSAPCPFSASAGAAACKHACTEELLISLKQERGAAGAVRLTKSLLSRACMHACGRETAASV